MKIKVINPCYSDGNLEKFVDEIEAAIEKYNLKTTDDQMILSFNPRLKSVNGNFSCRWKRNPVTCSIEIFGVKIEINVKAYRKFGLNEGLGTLRHELAHWIDYSNNGIPKRRGVSGHNEKFLRLCSDIGGTMSAYYAGERYKHCITKNFILPKNNYKYTCPTCGMTFETIRRRAKKHNKVCRKCRTDFEHWKEEKIG